jgi:hypothetical protein
MPPLQGFRFLWISSGSLATSYQISANILQLRLVQVLQGSLQKMVIWTAER